jgi:hypothetical protein
MCSFAKLRPCRTQEAFGVCLSFFLRAAGPHLLKPAAGAGVRGQRRPRRGRPGPIAAAAFHTRTVRFACHTSTFTGWLSQGE